MNVAQDLLADRYPGLAIPVGLVDTVPVGTGRPDIPVRVRLTSHPIPRRGERLPALTYATHQLAACPSRKERTEAIASLPHEDWRLWFQHIEWERAARGSDIIVIRADEGDVPMLVLDTEMSFHY